MTQQEKDINRFIIICVEQYANSVNQPGAVVYKKMKDSGIIDELTNDYEDLQGMSFVYLNDYIGALLKD